MNAETHWSLAGRAHWSCKVNAANNRNGGGGACSITQMQFHSTEIAAQQLK